MIEIVLGCIIALQCLTYFYPLRSGGDGFNAHDRIDLMYVRRRTEVIMAQLDDLLGILETISSDVNSEVSRLTDLENQLTALQNSTPTEVDLQPAIDLASSIRSRLEGTASAATTAGSDTAAQPQTGNTTVAGGAGTSLGGGDVQEQDPSVSDPSIDPSAGVTSGDTGSDQQPQG